MLIYRNRSKTSHLLALNLSSKVLKICENKKIMGFDGLHDKS